MGYWSSLSSMLARFMGYCSSFRVPNAISMIDEPRGAFTSWWATLTILVHCGLFHVLLITVMVDSSPFHRLILTVSLYSESFHGLFITVLESRCNSHDWWTPRAFMGQSSPLWSILAVSCAFAHHLVLPMQFPWLMNLEVHLRFGQHYTQFWLILARFMGY